MDGLDILLSKTNLPVHIAEDPISCVAVGTGKALHEMHTLYRVAVKLPRDLYKNAP